MAQFIRLALAVLILGAATSASQAQRGAPVPSPTPPITQDQDPIKVFTEEVRLPVVAVDQYGRFDPTMVADDILVQEDGVPQEIASVRRIPASVLMLLGTGGGPNPAVKTSTTRDVALRLLSRLRMFDRVAVMQFSNKVEQLQPWTEDQKAADHVLRNQLHTGNGTLLVPALRAAAAMLQLEPVGNRHLVLITDGVDVPDGRAKFADLMDALKPSAAETAQRKAEWEVALKEVLAAQVTVHIISYATYARQVYAGKAKDGRKIGVLAPPDRPAGADPVIYGRSSGAPTMGVSITFDPQMRKLKKAYENAMKTTEPRLAKLADETGAKLRAPESADEMVNQAEDIARDIGAQYVVTYLPKRPLSESTPGEYRRIQVSTRRIGLQLRTRRGYLVTRAASGN